MTPGRAIYEHRRPGDPAPSVPWEELSPEEREFHEGQAQAAAPYMGFTVEEAPVTAKADIPS